MHIFWKLMYKPACRTSKCTRMQNNQFSAPAVLEVLMQEIQPNEFKQFVFAMPHNVEKHSLGIKMAKESYYLYCCTAHFEDSLSIAHQQIH